MVISLLIQHFKKSSISSKYCSVSIDLMSSHFQTKSHHISYKTPFQTFFLLVLNYPTISTAVSLTYSVSDGTIDTNRITQVPSVPVVLIQFRTFLNSQSHVLPALSYSTSVSSSYFLRICFVFSPRNGMSSSEPYSIDSILTIASWPSQPERRLPNHLAIVIAVRYLSTISSVSKWPNPKKKIDNIINDLMQRFNFIKSGVRKSFNKLVSAIHLKLESKTLLCKAFFYSVPRCLRIYIQAMIANNKIMDCALLLPLIISPIFLLDCNVANCESKFKRTHSCYTLS